jgi:hypothetical protein
VISTVPQVGTSVGIIGYEDSGPAPAHAVLVFLLGCQGTGAMAAELVRQ